MRAPLCMVVRRPRCFWYAVPPLLVLLLSLSSCETIHQQESVSRKSEIEKGQHRADGSAQRNAATNEFFYPKIDLKSLRFAFPYRGKMAFKIQEQSLWGDFVKETGFEADTFNACTDDLTAQQENWLLKRGDEARIPRWGLLNPKTYETKCLPFQGMTVAPGESASLVALLGSDRKLSDWKAPKDDRIVEALAFPCAEKPRAQQMHKEENDAQVLTALRTFLNQEIPEARLAECYQVYVSYPDKIAHLITFYVGEEKILALISRQGAGYVFNPMRLKRAESRLGGMTMEHANPSWDTALHHTQIFILPDIDGNGSNEIYIHSTISFVMSIIQEGSGPATLEEIQSFYVGP